MAEKTPPAPTIPARARGLSVGVVFGPQTAKTSLRSYMTALSVPFSDQLIQDEMPDGTNLFPVPGPRTASSYFDSFDGELFGFPEPVIPPNARSVWPTTWLPGR